MKKILALTLMLVLAAGCSLLPTTPTLIKVGTPAAPTAAPAATTAPQLGITSSAVEPLAKLSEVSGIVFVAEPGGKNKHAGVVGESLFLGYEITTDTTGRTKLFFADGTTVRLAPSTQFVLTSRNKDAAGAWYTKITVNLGQVWIALNGGSFDVETPVGVGAVRGSDLTIKITRGADGRLTFTAACISGDCTVRDRVTGAVVGKVDVGKTVDLLDNASTSNFQPTAMTKALLDEWILNNPGPQNVILVQAAAIAAGVTNYQVPPAGTVPGSPALSTWDENTRTANALPLLLIGLALSGTVAGIQHLRGRRPRK